jgi:3-hydroxyacyl-[acyl-carrier-protein] dehydratase
MSFLLIDAIDRLESGRWAEGHKRISADESYFSDHFPGLPIVPGVLVVESLAQLGGRLVERSVEGQTGRHVLPLLAKIDRARFLNPVQADSRLDLRVEISAISDDAARVNGVARVGSTRVATVTLMYAMADLDDDSRFTDPAQRTQLREWSARTWAWLCR